MTRTRFQQGLDELRTKLLAMGGMAEHAIELAVRALCEHDQTAAQQVLEREAEINAIEREIDELAFDLLAMQQPMAVDLRFILAIIKINADLERVGDQAVNVAQRALDLMQRPTAELPIDIPRMAELASTMVRIALEAFLSGDADRAQGVLETDDQVDSMNREIFSVVSEAIKQQPDVSRQALDTLIVARNLERIADHATNIAEDVIFWKRGFDVRHSFHTPNHTPTQA
jgi:phosphate transport system protein